MAERDRLPSGGSEQALEARGCQVGHDPVKRLPVDVDYPQQLAEGWDHRVDQCLPNGAFIELGVADEGDRAAASLGGEVVSHVAVGERAPNRRGRADADRARREVDLIWILAPAWIRLQAAELAQRRQVAAIETAEQVLDRVQYRRGVRLDGDAVFAAKMSEVERGHDRDHRRRRGLVAADLDARRRLAQVIGVVDDARRQPEDALLDLG